MERRLRLEGLLLSLPPETIGVPAIHPASWHTRMTGRLTGMHMLPKLEGVNKCLVSPRRPPFVTSVQGPQIPAERPKSEQRHAGHDDKIFDQKWGIMQQWLHTQIG